jgi:hypothetical protein
MGWAPYLFDIRTGSMSRRALDHHWRWTLMLAGLALGACSSAPTAGTLTNAPPTLNLTGTLTVVNAGTSQAALQAAALVTNTTSVHIRLATAPACPLYVNIFPDATGEQMGFSNPNPCPVATETVDMAPGDTVTLTRLVPASDLAAYAAGVYGVNVGITDGGYSSTTWAGAIRLPLAPMP